MRKKKISAKKILSKKEPEKGLLLTFKSRAGRGRSGRITVRHQGGGVKKRYRITDFGQKRKDISAKVLALEYDPYRTAFLMLLEYENGEKRYRIAPDKIKVGDTIICSESTEIKTGNRNQNLVEKFDMAIKIWVDIGISDPNSV